MSASAVPVFMGKIQGDPSGLYNCRDIELRAVSDDETLYTFSH